MATLTLPKPHAGQQRVMDEAKRFNVVCCGRRWGKTELGMDRLIHPALEGKGKPLGSIACRDITSGNNASGGAQGSSAGPGFDPASGWGSSNGRNLFSSL